MPEISARRRAKILQALAHPNRIRILEAIRCGKTCNCEIGPYLNLEQSNLSRHIKILTDSGIVIPERDGVRINYRPVNQKIYQILDLCGEQVKDEAKYNILDADFQVSPAGSGGD